MIVNFNWEENNSEELVKSCEKNLVTPFIFRYLVREGKALEAGCGIGHFVKFLSDKGYDIEGVEIGKNAVDSAGRVFPDCRIFQGDVEHLPYEDDCFDSIISLGVVKHIIGGPEKALREMYRVLRPGGIMIFTIPLCNTLRKLKIFFGVYYWEYFIRKIYYKIKKKNVDWLHSNRVNETGKRRFHTWPFHGSFFEYRFTRREIVGMLKEANFKFLDEKSLDGMGGLYHEFGGYFVNLSKPNLFWRLVDKVLSVRPFFHQHTYLAIVKK